MNKEVIGIAGGMGPAAGIDLSEKIVSQTLATSDQEHIPLMLFSFPGEIEDRTEYIIGKSKVNPGEKIADIILQMEKSGATIAGIACNSAHAPPVFEVVNDILKHSNSKVKLLNMIEETALFVRTYYPSISKVGILGTKGSYRSGLYDKLEDHGLTVVNITQKEQELLHSAIYHRDYGIKSLTSLTGEAPQKAKSIIIDACLSLKAKGAEVIIFGCTEFPLVIRHNHVEGLPVIDTNLVLARALIYASAPDKLKPWQ